MKGKKRMLKQFKTQQIHQIEFEYLNTIEFRVDKA